MPASNKQCNLRLFREYQATLKLWNEYTVLRLAVPFLVYAVKPRFITVQTALANITCGPMWKPEFTLCLETQSPVPYTIKLVVSSYPDPDKRDLEAADNPSTGCQTVSVPEFNDPGVPPKKENEEDSLASGGIMALGFVIIFDEPAPGVHTVKGTWGNWTAGAGSNPDVSRTVIELSQTVKL